jgi:hypothetical protein
MRNLLGSNSRCGHVITNSAFAAAVEKDYVSGMGYSRALRKAGSLLLALAVILGAVGHARAAAGASLTMPAAAMASIPDGMDCDGMDKAKHAVCVATCAVTAALLETPYALPAMVAVADRLTFAELPPAEHGPTPEPHPPKH